MDVKVTVGILAYNHEKYIAAAIESILQQETNFQYKIVILDDASTDKTPLIIQAYQNKYPDIIEAVLSTEHTGYAINKLRLYQFLTSDYYTILNGNDLWYSKDRLQYQVGILESNREFSICLGQVHYLYENNAGAAVIPENLLNIRYEITSYFNTPINFINAGALFRNIHINNELEDTFANLNDCEKCVIKNDNFFMLKHLEQAPMCILPKVTALHRENDSYHQSNVQKYIENAIEYNFYRKYYKNRYADLTAKINKGFDYHYTEMWKCLINGNYMLPNYQLSFDDNLLLQGLQNNLIAEKELRKSKIDILNNHTYKGELTPQKRFLAIGFDDFRDSDFSLIAPLFKKYGFSATFNRIHSSLEMSYADIAKMDYLLENGNEIGDHTWFHCNFIYDDPLFNGQEPDNTEGEQIPFPSNDEMRCDRGDGRNVFGIEINELAKKSCMDGMR